MRKSGCKILKNEMYTNYAGKKQYHRGLLPLGGEFEDSLYWNKTFYYDDLDGDGKPLPYGSSAYANTYAIYGRNVSKIYVYVCDYTEYMDDIKGYRNDADFKKILEEKALYAKEIVF